MNDWERGQTRVRWLGGGIYVEHGGQGLVLDAPPVCADVLGERLERVSAIGISSGRIQALGGLLPLLVAMERHPRRGALELHLPLWDERAESIVDAWSRGWPGAYAVVVDGEMPGVTWELGGLSVETISVRHGEPRWGLGSVEGGVGIGFRVTTEDAVVSWVPGAGPCHALRRLAQAHLCVVEVGVGPWPSSPEPWRLTEQEAVRWCQGAGELWLVGDDGHRLSHAQA